MVMSIDFERLSYTYQADSPLAFQALHEITFTIPEHSYTAIIGHTGSGKSTLLQQLNGLLKPTTGSVTINGQTITAETKNKELKELRQEVGFVFQFPEAQLFEETVLKDIAFAPQNFGKTEEEALEIARQKARVVNLPEEVWEKSPFELSGGQMRRVAIAGILAMEPKILVLDEPSAGLDPKGRLEMMELFESLHQEQGLTIVLVTHQMNDVVNYANQVIVLEKGIVIKEGTPDEIFSQPDWLKEHHLGLPDTLTFAYRLAKKGIPFSEGMPYDEASLAHYLGELIVKRGANNG